MPSNLPKESASDRAEAVTPQPRSKLSESEVRRSLGRHLMLEVYDCPSGYLDDPDEIRRLLLDVARKAGASVIDSMFHSFAPQGVSGVVLIAESHLTIHTWPELGCAAIDMFSCSPLIDLDQIAEHLARELRARRIDARVVERGRIPRLAP